MSHSTRQIAPNMQKRHTNIAVVRVKKGGKRFEIACYKNKILNWRSGVETNIEDVLQIKDVFKDVSTGERIKKQDLQRIFKTKSLPEVMKYILDKGDLQLSVKEREHIFQNKWREIVTFLSDQCLNPVTNRPYPYGFIDREMKSMHFSVLPFKNTKMQALKCLKKLKERIDIIRARMQISLSYPRSAKRRINNIIKEHPNNCEVCGGVNSEETRDRNSDLEMELWIDPGLFRVLRESIEEVGGEIKILVTGLEESENDLIDIGKIKEKDHTNMKRKIQEKEEKPNNESSKKKNKNKRKNRKGKGGGNRFNNVASSDENSSDEEKKEVTPPPEDEEEETTNQGGGGGGRHQRLTKQEKRKKRKEKRKRKETEKKMREQNQNNNEKKNNNNRHKIGDNSDSSDDDDGWKKKKGKKKKRKKGRK